MLHKILYLLVSAILLFVTPPSLAFSTTSNCAKEAYLRHDSFVDFSRKLHDLARTGTTSGQQELSEELFNIVSDLKHAATLCPDARLPKLFNDSAKFLFLTYKEDRLLELYTDFLRTTPLTREQYTDFSDNLYRMTWQARKFERLDALKHEFPVSLKTTEFYPDTFQNSIRKSDMLLKPRFSAGTAIEVHSQNLNMTDLQVVVVVDLLDGSSRRIFDDLQLNPQIFDFKDNILFLFAQSSHANFIDLANISQVIAEYDFALVNNEDSWPKDMYFHQYPRFYFMHNNRVLEQISGWPSAKQAEAINTTYQRLKSALSN